MGAWRISALWRRVCRAGGACVDHDHLTIFYLSHKQFQSDGLRRKRYNGRTSPGGDKHGE